MTLIVIVKAYEMMLFTQGHMRMGFVKRWKEKKHFNFNLYLLLYRAGLHWSTIHFKNAHTGLTMNTMNNEHRQHILSQVNTTMENLVTFVLSMLAVCQNARPLFGKIRYNALLCMCVCVCFNVFSFIFGLVCFCLLLCLDCFV